MVQQRWIIVLPLVAILIIALAFYLNETNNQVAVSFQVRLKIDYETVNATGRLVPYGIAVPASIGRPGGAMASQRYLSDGVNGNYPLYTTDLSGTIYVASRVARNYSLGDFFEVWGQPLGPANTLGLRENFTCTTPPCASGTGVRDFFWDMCIISPSSGTLLPSIDWGAHVLTNRETVELFYSRLGCF